MGRTDRIMDALRFTDADLYEGDEESRRVARERRRRQARVDAARANRSWLELPPDGIEHHGRYVVDKHDGRVFERLRPGVDVWPGGDPSQGLLNPDVADAFVVVDGDVVFLRRARGGAETIDDLRWLEADREDQAARARAKADEELNDFRASQPRVPVLLADVVGHDLPTLRQAIQTIIDCGGSVDARRDGVSVELPERLAPADADNRRIHDDLMDCVRVVVAAKILPSALTSDSRKDLVDPDPYRPR